MHWAVLYFILVLTQLIQNIPAVMISYLVNKKKFAISLLRSVWYQLKPRFHPEMHTSESFNWTSGDIHYLIKAEWRTYTSVN